MEQLCGWILIFKRAIQFKIQTVHNTYREEEAVREVRFLIFEKGAATKDLFGAKLLPTRNGY